MKYLQVVLATILYIGTVDSIDNELASTEITASDNQVHRLQIPTLMFPCELKEADMFYFVYVEDIIEIRCGEPPVNTAALYVPPAQHRFPRHSTRSVK